MITHNDDIEQRWNGMMFSLRVIVSSKLMLRNIFTHGRSALIILTSLFSLLKHNSNKNESKNFIKSVKVSIILKKVKLRLRLLRR